MESTLSHLIDTVRTAIENKKPLRILGNGSKDFYGEPRDLSLPVLDTRTHSGIVSYEPSELVMTVKAGTLLSEVEAALKEKNQCFPFEPPHYSGQPTIGGMVAAGLSGPARATVGSVRDYVLGAHFINGKAEHLQFGGTVMKNVAGYDVSRLLAGSMGSLGVMTQVSLKVLAIAPCEATLRFEMNEAAMIQSVNEWAGQPLPINASSWVMDNGQSHLYLRLRGAVAAVESACKMFTDQHGAARLDTQSTQADWQAARDLKLPWFEAGFKRGQDLWRLSVPPTSAPLNVGDSMIDWLGGQRWVFAPAGDEKAAQSLRQAAAKAHGNATLFIAAPAHSTGDKHQKPSKISRFDALKPPLDRILAELKRQFDPLGIFA